MSSASLDLTAQAVLDRYRFAVPGMTLNHLGNRGGFSGARLWRLEGRGGPYCLRAWPPTLMTGERLAGIHRLMTAARDSGLTFVPAVFATPQGSTWVEHRQRLWDLTSWLPGKADFHRRPTPARLTAACEALARLHLAWAGADTRPGPCPAVQRRLDFVREWTSLVASGWRPRFAAASDPVQPWAERAWRLLRDQVERLGRRLAAWLGRAVPLQPCLCDVWHDHVLFEGESVSGLVDYGSVKVDHVAVDLARLLGSLVGDDEAQWTAGLEAYVRLHPLSEEERALATMLDETGTLLGAGNWLRWLYQEERHFEDRSAVATRLAALVQRVENSKQRSVISNQ
jgi:homoserine kinase type II